MSWIHNKLAGKITAEGRCLVATGTIRKGERLIVWDGKIVEASAWQPGPLAEPVLAAQIDEDLLLTTVEDGPGDWINHSCDPNAGMGSATVLVALRTIRRGEQVCYDYAFTDSLPFDEFDCACGTARCRARVSHLDWNLGELQQRYFKYFSPYLKKRIQAIRASQAKLSGEEAVA
jgi:hypothetical protein